MAQPKATRLIDNPAVGELLAAGLRDQADHLEQPADGLQPSHTVRPMARLFRQAAAEFEKAAAEAASPVQAVA
jgi:hypothetical protein